MPRKRPARRLCFLLVLPLLALVMVWLLWTLAPRFDPLGNTAVWRQQLASMSDEQLIHHLTARGAGRVSSLQLIEALGTGRNAVVDAARDMMLEQLDRWQLEAARHGSIRVAGVARQLARRCDQWTPAAQEAASQIAVKILLWPIDGRAVDQEQLIADCERILRSNALCRDPDSPADAAAPSRRTATGALPTSNGGAAPAGTEPTLSEQQFFLPGGNLPIHVSRLPHDSASER